MKTKKEKQAEPSAQTEPAKIKKTFTRRIIVMGIAGLLTSGGIGFFILYATARSMMVAVLSVLLLGAGISLLVYYWQKTDEIVIKHLDGVITGEANSLCLYPDRVIFDSVHKPEGYPQQCLNDKKYYYVLQWYEDKKQLAPFTLPDQQYYDPEVFAQRVLALPAHQKIFTRKPDLFQKIKTGLLVLAILIVWILIITTT